MNIDELLDLMEETLEDAATLPFTGGKRAIDVDKIKDLLDDVRMNMPQEIKQAKAIVNDRNDILSGAKREAETIIQKAEDRARNLVKEEEVVKQAQERATEILSTAQAQAREMRTNVTSYCENMLQQTEEVLARSTAEVKNVRSTLRKSAKK